MALKRGVSELMAERGRATSALRSPLDILTAPDEVDDDAEGEDPIPIPIHSGSR